MRSNAMGENFMYVRTILDGAIGRGVFKRDDDVSDAEIDMDYFLREQIIAGDVDEVVQNCLARYEAAASGEFYPPVLAQGNRAVLGKM